MSDRAPDPRAIDLMALCRQAGSLQGQWPLAALERLAAGLAAVPAGGTVDWTAQGRLVPVAGGEPEIWLHLEAHAAVSLQCQRCLQPMAEQLDVDRRFRFVRSEEEAERLDEASEDDVLTLPPRLDLRALVEDELILALPLVPRHAQCPRPLPMPQDGAGDEASAPHPFAALAGLRGRAKGGA